VIIKAQLLLLIPSSRIAGQLGTEKKTIGSICPAAMYLLREKGWLCHKIEATSRN